MLAASDGSYPAAGVIFDADGDLYSTTYQGGSSNTGTVFNLAPPAAPEGTWTKTTLYSFAGGSDGANPWGDLVFGSRSLYGTTSNGGSGTFGTGTVFKLTPPGKGEATWTEAVLHSFAGGSDGASLSYPLIFSTTKMQPEVGASLRRFSHDES